MRNRLLVGGKQALLAAPFSPRLPAVDHFAGRASELTLLAACWLAGADDLPLSPLLVGVPGTGKNRLVYELARRSDRELFIFQGHEDVTAEDLACCVRFCDGACGALEYVLSPLSTAMVRGAICFIDEIGKVRPRALSLLVSVLDERRYIDSTLLGERILAAPGFRFVAATNSGEVHNLPEFLRSRLRPVIRVGPLSRADLDQVLCSRFESLAEHTRQLLSAFWAGWAGSPFADRAPTPRDGIHVLSLASRLAEFEARSPAACGNGSSRIGRLSLESNGSSAPPEPRHVEEAFSILGTDLEGTDP